MTSWLTVLFVVGLEVAQQQSSSGLVAVVLMLPFGLAMVLLSARIWRGAALPAGDNLCAGAGGGGLGRCGISVVSGFPIPAGPWRPRLSGLAF